MINKLSKVDAGKGKKCFKRIGKNSAVLRRGRIIPPSIIIPIDRKDDKPTPKESKTNGNNQNN